jgi:ankyrin repeat protein
LFNNNANIQSLTKDGWTALHLACEEEHIEIISFLLDNNIDINIRTREGNTALNLICLKKNLDIMNLMFDKAQEWGIQIDKKKNLKKHIIC